MWAGRWCSLWSGPCSLWSRRNTSCSTLHTIAGRLQMLGHRSRKPRISGFARSGVAVVLQCCGRVALVLRWSGQWSQSMVRSVVQSVVWSSGPVGGLVCGLVCGDGPFCGPVRAVMCGLWCAPYNGLPASNAWILAARGLCSFVTFVILRSPDPGPRTLCPQNVVRAASWRRLWGSAQVHAATVSEFVAFLEAWLSIDTMVILGSTRVCASISWRLKRSQVLQLTAAFPLFRRGIL